MSIPYTQTGSRKRFWTNLVLAIPAIGMLIFFATYRGCNDVCADWDYVSDMLFDDDPNNTIQRWADGPTVATDTATAAEVEMLIGAVYELNQLLRETGVSLRFIDTGPADIDVTFASRDALNELDPDYQIDTKVQGYASWSARDPNIGTAQVFIVTNLSQGNKWGTLLHELGHVIGFVGHTDRYYSSLFHAELGYGPLSDGFSADDRALLRFLYQYLEPGMNEAEARTAFDKYWVLRSR